MLSLIKSLKISHELQPGINLSMQMNHERARESPQQGLTLSLSRSPSTLLYHYHVFLIMFVVRICCLVRQPLPVIDFALFRSLAACNCVGTVWKNYVSVTFRDEEGNKRRFTWSTAFTSSFCNYEARYQEKLCPRCFFSFSYLTVSEHQYVTPQVSNKSSSDLKTYYSLQYWVSWAINFLKLVHGETWNSL